MRARLVAALLGAVVAAGCGEENEPAPARAAPAETELTITVDPDGDGPRAAREHELACPGDPGCEVLAQVPGETYTAVPGDRACSARFGGSQTAKVSGRLNGKPLEATFSRQNGCEIARWDDAEPLLALAG